MQRRGSSLQEAQPGRERSRDGGVSIELVSLSEQLLGFQNYYQMKGATV